MKKIFWALMLYAAPAFHTPLISQNLLKQSTLAAGFAIQPQDRRLFDFPRRQDLTAGEKTRLDFEYSLFFTKQGTLHKRYQNLIGIGYALSQSTFDRPFAHSYFTGIDTEELRITRVYFIHNICLNLAQRYFLLPNLASRFYIQPSVMAKFAFNKHIDDYWDGPINNPKFNEWLFEANHFEAYLGAGHKLKKLDIGLNFRLLNFQKIDHVIFNHLLFDEPNPPFLKKKFEFRNLPKFMLTVAYSLSSEK